MSDAVWCAVCDLEWAWNLQESAGVKGSRVPRCRVCRQASLTNGDKPITQRQLSLALRRVLDALDVNP